MASVKKSIDRESKKPSHNMTSKYAVLQEYNDKEMETWLYFIRYDGNEENIEDLKKQLESIEWSVMEDCSVFDIDTEHLVSAQTAKEMTKVELNAGQWHRKFDGKLDKIDLEFKKKDDDEDKMCKTFDHLGYGQIEDYISDEDIDDEDLTDTEYSDEDEESDKRSDKHSESESESDEELKETKKKPTKLPASLAKKNK
jgi:hypothetical protein